MKYSIGKVITVSLLSILLAGLVIPQRLVFPVEGADHNSFNPQSFWYYPWGRSVTHKGVDIFASRGAPVLAATHGMVLFSGQLAIGGNVAIVLGPKWRIHYYAHLDQIDVSGFTLVSGGNRLGTVGSTGNAAGKPHICITQSSP